MTTVLRSRGQHTQTAERKEGVTGRVCVLKVVFLKCENR